ncbi:MAG: hypothetical protein ACFFD2_08130 [Promethearchaeota archaeon]
MSTTELSKGVSGNNEQIKIKNRQLFSVIALCIIISFFFALRGNFIYGEGTIKRGVMTGNRYYITYHKYCSYYITNPEAYSEYMQNGLRVKFIGVISLIPPGFFPAQVLPKLFPRIHLLYVRELNEFPPISLMLLIWVLIYLACIVGIFGIIYLLYKVFMIKDKRIYLKGSKSSNLMKKTY